nr:MAG: ORF1 [TTV-like mini virus]
MPWWRRPYRRRRRFWTRRPRSTFRWRLWRRKRRRPYFYGVRKKRKLPFLYLTQWQPQYIRKLTISGTQPLYATTHQRIANNSTLYLETIAPHFVPSLGGFSITQFTLKGLYEQFSKARAWWTQGNADFPLIRYTGCTITLYNAEASDYVFTYHNCYPMKATLEAYQSTQPSLMMLQKGRKIIKCRKHNNIKKPYKKIRIHPPAQFKNQWFFQKDISEIPLLMFRATATSLDRVFMASNSQSTTIGFKCLNSQMFKHHDWVTPPQTQGYTPKNGIYFYSYSDSSKNWQQVTLNKLIYLGDSNNYTLGQPLGDWSNTATATSPNYPKEKWGNVFHNNYLTGAQPVLISDKFITTLIQGKTKDTTLQNAGLTEPTHPLIIECRYNSYADKGTNNDLYLQQCLTPTPDWSPPTDPQQQTNNLPLWLAAWGFIDFHKAAAIVSRPELNYILVFFTDYINPSKAGTYIPLDEDFLSGTSPYRPRGEITPSDRQNWHPKLAFQLKTYNEICASGPYTIKLPPNVSAEAHCKFAFHFKLGGCAQPTKDIKNPDIQPTFPIPNNMLETTSFQSPTTSFQNFLYNFDWRRGFLTAQAAERISKYLPTETTLFEPTGDQFNPQTSPQSSQETNSSTQEKEKEALQLLIQQQQRQQQQFKRRIYRLLMSNTT